VNDGTCCQAQTFLLKRPAFILKSAHTSIGGHNEYFLHHRRSDSYHLCCRLLWSAHLNMEWKIRTAAAIATTPFRDGYPRTNGFVCPRSPAAALRGRDPRQIQLIENDRIVADAVPSYPTRLVLTLSLPLMFQPRASFGRDDSRSDFRR
jgi:hypothetical protein